VPTSLRDDTSAYPLGSDIETALDTLSSEVALPTSAPGWPCMTGMTADSHQLGVVHADAEINDITNVGPIFDNGTMVVHRTSPYHNQTLGVLAHPLVSMPVDERDDHVHVPDEQPVTYTTLKRARRNAKTLSSPRFCDMCGASDTNKTMKQRGKWRPGPGGKGSLCNA
jgi:hypothetical protein